MSKMITDLLANPIAVTIITILVVVHAILGICSYLILVERKLAAYVQDRIGPNRVGPWGLLQPIADGLKFLLKEEVIPRHVDKVLFIIAPCIAMITTMLAFAVVPFGPVSTNPKEYQFVIAPKVDIGILFIFAIGSLTVYAIILGGWASNNKYSLIGALRASAQVVSYEIPLGMSVLGVVLLANTMNLEEILLKQVTTGHWFIFSQPLAALIFLLASMAEAHRLPFDLSECEQELVGGYHTEYSAMKFAMFFLGEYTHMITTTILFSVMFLGGYHLPFIDSFAGDASIMSWGIKVGVLMFKAFCIILFIMMIRWTIPRFRFDQLMGLAWKGLIPLSIVNFVAVMIVKHYQLHWSILTIVSIATLVLLAVYNAKKTIKEIDRRPRGQLQPIG